MHRHDGHAIGLHRQADDLRRQGDRGRRGDLQRLPGSRLRHQFGQRVEARLQPHRPRLLPGAQRLAGPACPALTQALSLGQHGSAGHRHERRRARLQGGTRQHRFGPRDFGAEAGAQALRGQHRGIARQGRCGPQRAGGIAPVLPVHRGVAGQREQAAGRRGVGLQRGDHRHRAVAHQRDQRLQHGGVGRRRQEVLGRAGQHQGLELGRGRDALDGGLQQRGHHLRVRARALAARLAHQPDGQHAVRRRLRAPACQGLRPGRLQGLQRRCDLSRQVRLQQFERQARFLAQRSGQVATLGLHLGRCHHPAGPALGAPGRARAAQAAVQQVVGQAVAETGAEQVVLDGGGPQACRRVGVAVHGLAIQHQEIAGRRQQQAGTGGRALHPGDHRAREPGQRVEQAGLDGAVDSLPAALPTLPVRAGEPQHLQARFGAQLPQGVRQRGHALGQRPLPLDGIEAAVEFGQPQRRPRRGTHRLQAHLSLGLDRVRRHRGHRCTGRQAHLRRLGRQGAEVGRGPGDLAGPGGCRDGRCHGRIDRHGRCCEKRGGRHAGCRRRAEDRTGLGMHLQGVARTAVQFDVHQVAAAREQADVQPGRSPRGGQERLAPGGLRELPGAALARPGQAGRGLHRFQHRRRP